MAVIKTKRNFVCAYEPLPEDVFVKTYLRGSEERYLLLTQPIAEYQAAVDWAVSMADQMASPIDVVTVTAVEFMQSRREQLERGLAAMTDRERGALRQEMIKSMAEVMRDCDDADVRADAYDVLVKLRAVQ